MDELKELRFVYNAEEKGPLKTGRREVWVGLNRFKRIAMTLGHLDSCGGVVVFVVVSNCSILFGYCWIDG